MRRREEEKKRRKEQKRRERSALPKIPEEVFFTEKEFLALVADEAEGEPAPSEVEKKRSSEAQKLTPPLHSTPIIYKNSRSTGPAGAMLVVVVVVVVSSSSK